LKPYETVSLLSKHFINKKNPQSIALRVLFVLEIFSGGCAKLAKKREKQ